jgi:hypothetical protein
VFTLLSLIHLAVKKFKKITTLSTHNTQHTNWGSLFLGPFPWDQNTIESQSHPPLNGGWDWLLSLVVALLKVEIEAPPIKEWLIEVKRTVVLRVSKIFLF